MPRIVDLSLLPTFTAVNLAMDGGAIGGPIIIPNCLQVVLDWGMADGKVGHNVTYGHYAALPGNLVATAQSIFSGLTTGAAWTALAASLSTASSLQSVTVRDVNTQDQPVSQSTGASQAGTAAFDALPNEIAACLSLKTALTGRSNRGRAYIPGFQVNAVGSGNIISAGTVTALNNWAATWMSVYSAAGLQLSIGHVHRQAYTSVGGVQHPDRPAGNVPVTQVILRDNHWDSQRRRGLK